MQEFEFIKTYSFNKSKRNQPFVNTPTLLPYSIWILFVFTFAIYAVISDIYAFFWTKCFFFDGQLGKTNHI